MILKEPRGTQKIQVMQRKLRHHTDLTLRKPNSAEELAKRTCRHARTGEDVQPHQVVPPLFVFRPQRPYLRLLKWDLVAQDCSTNRSAAARLSRLSPYISIKWPLLLTSH